MRTLSLAHGCIGSRRLPLPARVFRRVSWLRREKVVSIIGGRVRRNRRCGVFPGGPSTCARFAAAHGPRTRAAAGPVNGRRRSGRFAAVHGGCRRTRRAQTEVLVHELVDGLKRAALRARDARKTCPSARVVLSILQDPEGSAQRVGLRGEHVDNEVPS